MKYNIGDKVVIKGTTHMGYNDVKERKPYETPCEPMEVFVIGVVKRQLGKYQKGYNGGYDEDAEPPSLKVTGTIELIQCRKTIRSKIIEVQYSQIQDELARQIRNEELLKGF